MTNLENFLAPFSQLLFANRNIVIFFLCLVLFLAALDALIHRWKTQRLHQELSNARSSGSYAPARRYSGTSGADEAPREPGGALPPVKGGRTYARNLGSALQKAGMSSPQIYSPPTPAGWAPNSNPSQPGQPGMPAPYTAPTTPWGAPAAPATPWAFQGGAGRPSPGQAPSPVPFYQPQPPAPQSQPAGMPGAPAPSASTPGLYAPPSPAQGAFPPPPPFGQPALPTPATNTAAPAFAPPSQPGPPMMPGFPPAAAPAPQPVPDGGRRGKPKRRRFNFNVLENLEKMVQSKAAEPAPSTGWTPPPAAPAPAVAPPQPGFQAGPAPSAATAAGTPPAEARSTSAASDTPALPLEFGVPAAEKPAAQEPAAEQPVVDYAPPATVEKRPDAVGPAAEAVSEPEPGPQAEPEPATAPEPEAEKKADARRSMRSMMFGEEVAAPATQALPPDTPESVPAPEVSASEPAAQPSPEPAESDWPSYPWSRREEASSSGEAATTPEPESAVEPAESSHEAEPVAESASSEAFDPWKPSFTPEPESTTEPEPAIEAEPAVAAESESAATHVPDEPVTQDPGKPSAGTLVIIEDDPTAASYYATLFRGNGYQVEVATDGVSGVDLATRMQPQVILLDVMMPRQNGILVLQTLRASDETKNTPVVVMSNFSEPTLIKRALQLGALEYVIKTQVEGPALLNALPRWMNREKAFAAA